MRLVRSFLVAPLLAALSLGGALQGCGVEGLEGDEGLGQGKAEVKTCLASEIEMDGQCAALAELCGGDPGEVDCLLITSPSEDQLVKDILIVQGYASLPADQHVWVLFGSNNNKELWWPVGEPTIDPETLKWSQRVHLSAPRHQTNNFLITVAVMDEEQHTQLEAYKRSSDGLMEWGPPPIHMSPPVNPHQITKVVVSSGAVAGSGE